MAERDMSDYIGWPEACYALGLARAVHFAASGHLTVFGYQGRRLVKRANVARLKQANPASRRQRGDVLPPLAPDLGPRR